MQEGTKLYLENNEEYIVIKNIDFNNKKYLEVKNMNNDILYLETEYRQEELYVLKIYNEDIIMNLKSK